ncbi:hypothetical protein DAPPUDRAFT_236943 [Daphnia pulex]|uniref:Uncharacterized protein n=1 Tax=Daphnia pulex TaxID=6669 RepID=E9G2C2_DAPPU|nr:hypothetical protein DAPPUDRAFT_236943 [Daphnia pulex]|eukprot:EFX86222.1 hypothetical protein DAPPUDRAFT_236943 [Daphnia pulex]
MTSGDLNIGLDEWTELIRSKETTTFESSWTSSLKLTAGTATFHRKVRPPPPPPPPPSNREEKRAKSMKVECVHSSRDDDSRGTGQVVRTRAEENKRLHDRNSTRANVLALIDTLQQRYAQPQHSPTSVTNENATQSHPINAITMATLLECADPVPASSSAGR